MPRYRLDLAYLGRDFAGWQLQAEGVRTVQGAIEEAVREAVGETVRVHGASRTDAGVHAAGQVAHLDLVADVPAASLRLALDTVTSDDLSVLRARLVDPRFHARFDAGVKRYVYRMRWQRRPATPWWAQRRAAVRPIIRPQLLQECLDLFVGKHDFASFTRADQDCRTTVRRIHRAEIRCVSSGASIELVGSAFLRMQVRRMVGLLLQIDRGRLGLDDLRDLLENPRFGSAKLTAEARGLTLESIRYPRES